MSHRADEPVVTERFHFLISDYVPGHSPRSSGISTPGLCVPFLNWITFGGIRCVDFLYLFIVIL